MSGGSIRAKLAYLLLSAALVSSVVFLVIGCPGPEVKLLRQFRVEPTINLRDEKAGTTKKIKLEEYIAGVVAGEMKKGWPLQAYEAQAIIARSFALNTLTNGGQQPVEQGVISTSHVQAQAYAPQNITPIIRQAVNNTRGKVVTYKGQFINAYFHSAAGGKTTTAVDAGLVEPGAEPPYLKQVYSPENKVAPPEVKSWQASFSSDEVARAVSQAGASRPLNRVDSFQVGKKDSGGRAVTFVASGGGVKTEVPAGKFRLKIGPDRMRSAMITRVETRDGKVSMAGKGFGHGVGMAQYGAFQMAKEGKTAEEIIHYYFKGVKVSKLWK
ncbi:MAG: SpoIID/LytB domain-containing protein [Syntrophothermus sp.]